MSTAAYQRQWRQKHSTGRPSGRPVVAVCGTTSAYKRHLRHGETPCAACREAWNRWQRDYYRTRKTNPIHPDNGGDCCDRCDA